MVLRRSRVVWVAAAVCACECDKARLLKPCAHTVAVPLLVCNHPGEPGPASAKPRRHAVRRISRERAQHGTDTGVTALQASCQAAL